MGFGSTLNQATDRLRLEAHFGGLYAVEKINNRLGLPMLHVLAVAWLIGIAVMGQQISVLPSFNLVLLLLMLCLLGLQVWFHQRLQLPLLRVFNACCAAFFALMLGKHYADHALEQRLLLRENQVQQTEVIVYIAELNELKTQHIQQKIQVLNRHAQPVTWLSHLPNQAVDSAPSAPLKLGHYYKLSGEIRPAHSYAIAGVFDQEKWYLQQNIMANFRIAHSQELSPVHVMQQLGIQRLPHQGIWSGLHLAIERQRLAVREFMANASLQHQGLLLGLLTGDESLLSEQIKADFQRLGISHLLAISGPHVLILASLVCYSLQQLIRRYRPQLYLQWPKPYVLLLPFWLCVCLYSACVGFEIPALRTVFMVSVASLMLICKLDIRPLTVLLISAALLLYVDPFSVLSAAFWLSYVACFILLRIYQTVKQIKHQGHVTRLAMLKQGAWALCLSQGKIFVALLPLMLIFFQHVAWISPLTNVLAIPYLGLMVVPLDIVAALAWLLFEPLGHVLWQLNDVLLKGLMGVLAVVDALFQPSLVPVALNLVQWLALILALVILFLPRGVLPKPWVALSLCPLVFFDQSRYGFELSVLDVGQGQAIFIRHHDQTLMLDVGGSMDEQRFSVGEQLLFPFLARQGVTHLDQVILTHLDQDHSGGYERLAAKVPVKQVLSNEQPKFQVPHFRYCQAGQHWQWQQIRFEILSPFAEMLDQVPKQRNEHSCVVYISVPTRAGTKHFLVMGDAGWWTEYQLLQHYPNLKIDVLVVGHHGSKHSSAYAFLQHYQPSLSVVSAGRYNRYGHPSQELSARLEALDLTWHSTPHEGSLRFTVDATGQLQVTAYRQARRWLQRPPVPEHAP